VQQDRSDLKGNDVSGLVAWHYEGALVGCSCDIQTSGQTISAGGTGKTTTQIQTAVTFLEVGWDFVGEAKNGTENIWAICEGLDYPHLAWEFVIGDFDADADTDFADFCILAEHWLAADGSFWCGQGCDLTNDGSVNWQDLMVFVKNWVSGVGHNPPQSFDGMHSIPYQFGRELACKKVGYAAVVVCRAYPTATADGFCRELDGGYYEQVLSVSNMLLRQ